MNTTEKSSGGTALTFYDYSFQQAGFAKYADSVGIVYPLLGLLSEVGELSEKLLKYAEEAYSENNESETARILVYALRHMSQVADIINREDKRVRDTAIDDIDTAYCGALNFALKVNSDTLPIMKEMGDCLWMISDISKHLNVDLGLVAQMNLDKLNGRVASNTISGSGDDR